MFFISSMHRLPRLLALLLLLAPAAPATARVVVHAARNPRAVLVLVPSLPSEPLLRELDQPRSAGLLSGSGLAVMNCAVPGPDTPIAACLSLGAGQRLPYSADQPPPVAREGGGTRTSLAPFLRSSGERRDPHPGGLAGALARAGLKVACLGPAGPGGVLSGRGFLCAMDEAGRIRRTEALADFDGETWAARSEEILEDAEFLVIDLPPSTQPDAALALTTALSGKLDAEKDLLILTSPDPGMPQGGQWMELSPVLLWGAVWRGNVATSATTRTRGLLANTDLAPTILQHLGAGVPVWMEGHPAWAAGAGSLSEARRFAANARATRIAMAPGLIAWGVMAFGVVLYVTMVLVRRLGEPHLRRRCRILLAWVAAFIPGILLAACFPAASPAQLLGTILVLAIGTGSGAVLLGRRSPLVAVLLFAGALILVDLYVHGPMLARNLMSDFANVGARFYGIGNEHEGMVLAVTTLAPFWLEHTRGTKGFTSTGWVAALFLWVAVLIGVGAPALGADFGGALSLSIGFLVAAALAWGRRIRPVHVALAAIGLLGVVALLVLADLSRPAGSRSHVGELAARALSGGVGEVGEIASRKVLQNVRFALTPYFLVSIAAVTPLFWVWYHRLGQRTREVLGARPLLRAGMLATLAGAAATLVLNDSGVVAWAIATGCVLFLWLDLLVAAPPAPNPI